MQDNGWLKSHEPAKPSCGQQRAAERLQRREVRSFEVSHVHGLWRERKKAGEIGVVSRNPRKFRQWYS
jgi:hypothetical protein